MPTTSRYPTSNGGVPHLLHLPIQVWDMVVAHMGLTDKILLSLTCKAAYEALREDRMFAKRLTGDAKRKYVKKMKRVLTAYVICHNCSQKHLVAPRLVPYSLNWSDFGILLAMCPYNTVSFRIGPPLQHRHLLPRFKHEHFGIPELRYLRYRDDILKIIERKLTPEDLTAFTKWRCWGSVSFDDSFDDDIPNPSNGRGYDRSRGYGGGNRRDAFDDSLRPRHHVLWEEFMELWRSRQ